MPLYSFKCNVCDWEFDVYSKTFTFDAKSVKCEECEGKCTKQMTSPVIVMAPEGPSREERKESDRKKKVKDPERAEKNRKDLFGSQNVNVSKSDIAKQKHTFKKKIMPQAQGTTSDIDKTDFIKNAAKNPKALAAAQKAMRK